MSTLDSSWNQYKGYNVNSTVIGRKIYFEDFVKHNNNKRKISEIPKVYLQRSKILITYPLQRRKKILKN